MFKADFCGLCRDLYVGFPAHRRIHGTTRALTGLSACSIFYGFGLQLIVFGHFRDGTLLNELI